MSNSSSPCPDQCPPYQLLDFDSEAIGHHGDYDDVGDLDALELIRQQCEAAWCEADEEDTASVEFANPAL